MLRLLSLFFPKREVYVDYAEPCQRGWITISDSNEMADITFPSEQTAFMTVEYGAENLVVILNF